MEMKTKTLELLSQAGLPQFELGEDGYPLPGKVVKYYRERMMYTDRDGKQKHWTQADLAERLGLKEIMVNLMENKNQGLDSIERRRTLSTLLRIPPALLGLGSLELIVDAAIGQNELPPKNLKAKNLKIGKDTIKLYQKTFGIYKDLYAEGLSYASIQDIEKWTKRIERDAKLVSTEDKNTLLRVLWNYEILCSKMYGSDLQNWSKVFEHIDNAREIAMALNDRDLQAASLCHAGILHFRQGRIGLAKMDIDGALFYSKGALPQTKGIIYSKSACFGADTASTSEITLAQNTFDTAENYIDAKSEIKNISFGRDDYLLDRAYALLAFGRSARALELIDDAERYIDPSKKRFLIFLDILRARCYIKLKKPEYEQVVALLEGAIVESQEIRVARNIDHIEKLYRKLLESSYGKAPEVADLGLMLRGLYIND